MQILESHRLNRLLRAVLAVVLAAAIVLTAGFQPGAAAYAEEPEEQGTAAAMQIPEDAGDGYIVKVKEDRTSSEDAALDDALAQEDSLTALSYTEDVLAAEDADAVQGVDADTIEYVEVNHPVVLSDTAAGGEGCNDPLYAEQYYLDRMHVPAEQLSAASMEDAAGGANPPVIAVIDSGLYMGHEDIDAARVVPGKYFGKQEVTDDTSDPVGHGTAVTGLLMATSNNGTGIAGLTQGVKVMPLRVVDADGSCTEKQVIEAIHYAVEQKTAYDNDPSQGTNVQVINMSLEVALQEGEPSPKALQEACKEAMDAGILVVCAGGNGGGSEATYPAQYTLGVGATGYEESAGDIHAAESRLLSEANGEGYENKIWVCAPGVDITTTSSSGGSDYTTISGTSAAAPQVAALAALCKWIDPSLDQAAFKTLLKEHAQPLSGTSGQIGSQDVEFGYGLVDYEQVLSALGMIYGRSASPEAGSGSVPEETGDGTDPEAAENGGDAAVTEMPAVQNTAPAEAAVTGPADDPENPANDNAEEKETPAAIEKADFSGSNVQLQAGEYVMGIDVSYWDGEVIDWTKVRNAGVRFVFVRVGYASFGSGKLNEDYMFASNIQGAYNAGINVGVYFYSQATTPAEAKAEANYMISRVEPYRNYITLPMVMDMESPETYNGSKTHWARANVSKAQVATNYLAFADVVNQAGYVPMFYTYTSWIKENLGSSMSVISNSGYPVWLAEYPSSVGENPPTFTKLYGALYKYDFWQYSKTGRISGISTNVDLNRWYTTDQFKYDRRGHWEKDATGWKYFTYQGEQVKNGWARDRKGLVWMNADGYWDERTGWVDDHGEQYYILNGYRQADTWVKDRAGWRYVGSNGKIVKNGWAKDKRGWGYLNASGYWVTGTKWLRINGEWYHIRYGYRQENTWLKDRVGWCYAGGDGRLVKNGWAQDSRGWCWLNQNGYWVKKRWIKYKGEWYYLKSNGYMASKEWARDSVGWMWMAGSGKITKSRWIKDGRYWYYLKSNGYMATGKQTINGKVYWFRSSGKWIE